MTYNEEKLNKEIEKYLQGLCIFPNYKGYNYSKDAIKIIFNKRKNYELTCNLYKEVYTPISKKYNKSQISVERGLRTVIEKMVKYCDYQIIKQIFNINVLQDYKYKLTVSYFINIIAEKLILNYTFDDFKIDNGDKDENKIINRFNTTHNYKFFIYNGSEILDEFENRKLSLLVVCDKLGYTYEYLQNMLNGLEEVSEKLKIFLKDNKFLPIYILEESKDYEKFM